MSAPVGRLVSIVKVCFVCLTIVTNFSLNCPSIFVFLVFSLINTVESSSFGKSSGDICIALSVSKQVFGFSVRRVFIVFGLRPNASSNGLLLLAAKAVLRANRRRANPAFPFSVNIDFSARRHSLIVRISRSIFPFPRWSRTGHSICFMKKSLQNSLNFLPRNIVAGSVLILFWIPNCAICPCKKFMIFSAVGFLTNFALGQTLL